MDETGRLLGDGEVGELVMRGDLVMKGYFERPEENEKVSRFGWHHSGDVGYRDEDGLFFIVDRNKDMIISGGFNIYPSEIEQVLWNHPAVLDCAVIGVPDAEMGRGDQGRRRAQARRRRERGRAQGALPRDAGRHEDAEVDRDLGYAAAQRARQGAEARDP